MLTKENSDQALKPSKALPFSGKTLKWCNATQSHDWFPDKNWGGDFPAHSPLPSNTLIPLPNKKICQIFPPFFFFFFFFFIPVFSLSYRFNGDALCSRRNNPYWGRPEPNTIGRPSPIEPLSTTVADQTWRQKPAGLQQRQGSNVWHWDTAWQRCVWPQSTPLFNAVWERESFLFTRGSAEALQEMASLYDLFIRKTTCWKRCAVIAILTPLPLMCLSCIQSALLPPALLSVLFLHVELNDSDQVNSIYEASEYRVSQGVSQGPNRTKMKASTVKAGKPHQSQWRAVKRFKRCWCGAFYKQEI